MALKFSGAPYLKWGKVKRVNEDGEEHEVEVLCVCVDIENTGDSEKETKIDFRGYVQNTSRPPGPNAVFELCEGRRVKVPPHRTITECCCDFTRRVIDVVNWDGWIVVDSFDIDKNATTEGSKLKVPERTRRNQHRD